MPITDKTINLHVFLDISGPLPKRFGLVKNQVETVCHTVFHLVKNKVETFTPTFQFVLHPARLLPHPQNISTAAFPACPHAFCLPAGSGHPVRTIFSAYAA